MHPRNSIINLPLLIGIVLSIALHGAALYGRESHTAAELSMDQGRTVVQLTLLPSTASKGNPKPESLNPKPVPQAARLPEPAPPEPPVSESEPIRAPEQDASPIEDKGVITEASISSPFRPAYPRISQHRNEEGIVLLSVEVLASGNARNIKIVHSSGYRRLDEAALKAARKTLFTPAKQFGRAMDSTIELPFKFKLTDD